MLALQMLGLHVNAHQMHTFGCLVECEFPVDMRPKLGQRTQSCAYLGTVDYKAVLYNLATGRMFYSSRGSYHESVFPFDTSASASASGPTPPSSLPIYRHPSKPTFNISISAHDSPVVPLDELDSAGMDTTGDTDDCMHDASATGDIADIEPVVEQPTLQSEPTDHAAATLTTSSGYERPHRAAAIRIQQATTEIISNKDKDINEFLAAASVSGPPSYSVVMRSRESSLWQGAVMSELESIDNNGVVKLVPRS
ncbi:hypothetical protein H4R27_004785, partial [Coemansia aciculifera]